MIMAVRKIITLGEEGSEALRKICKPVDKFDDRLATLIDDMKETLAHADGLGLAAPQVGVLKRVVIVKYEEHEYELVNPRIIETSGESIDDEGCLSVKGQRGLVERPGYIKVEFFDRHGNKHVVQAEDYFARVFFHEIDHLDGVVFTDVAIRDRNGKIMTYDDIEEIEKRIQEQEAKEAKKETKAKKQRSAASKSVKEKKK